MQRHMNNQPIVEPNFEGETMKIPSSVDTAETTPEPTSILNGPIVLLLVAILFALLGGIYYWYTILMATPVSVPIPTRPTAEMNNEPESTTAEARTAAADVVSTSDDLDAISADVESINFEDLDTDFAAVDGELNSATKVSNTTP